MRCRKARKLISVRFDGELDEARERAVRVHLAACPACQRMAGEPARCADALNLLRVPEPGSGLAVRVMSRLPEPRTERFAARWWRESLRPGPAAAAAVALCCGIVMALSMNGEQSTESADRTDSADAIYAQSFEAVPGDSAAAIYLAMLQEVEN